MDIMLKRLEGKLEKRLSSRTTPGVTSPQVDTAGASSERLGLTFLGESKPDPNAREQYPVDIIAIHGLDGDAFSTWTHPNGTMWLKDLLPSFLPGCRVYTYGYPSKVFLDPSLSRVQEYSRGLLSAARDNHESQKDARSVIFVCHGLGGIIFKQALVFALEDDENYGTFLKSVIGVTFLGTPHRGSEVANLGSAVGSIIDACLTTASAGMRPGIVKTDLLDGLSYDSPALQDLIVSAKHRLGNIAVVTFYETEPTPPLSSLVVDLKSSILGIDNEDAIPLFADHRGICQFAGETQNYKAVSQAIRRIALLSQIAREPLKRASTHASDRTFNDIENSCMTLFSVFDVADYKRLLPKPAKDFLFQTDYIQDAFPGLSAINVEDSALHMSSACIRYLMLEDFSQDLFTGEDSSIESASGSSAGSFTAGFWDDEGQGLFTGEDSSIESSSGSSAGSFAAGFWDNEGQGLFTGETSSIESASGSSAGGLTGGFWDDEGQGLDADMLFREPGAPDTQTSQLIASKHSFYSYASLHWTEHFALCEASAPVELREAAETLLDVNTGACRNWLQFYHADVATAMDVDPTGSSSVTLAAYFNLHETLVGLLGSQESSQATKDQALFWASRNGHSRIVATLLGAGADPGMQGPETQTPLTAAAEHGHLGCLTTLLADNRTDLNIRGRNGRSALSFACANGHDDIVWELLGRIACEANGTDSSGTTPLFWASGGANMSIISTLVRHPGVDINHRDKTGRTAVSWAAGDGMEEVLKHLLKLRGIDANLKDNKGRSPLSWAAGNGSAATVEVLVENKKVDKDSLDRDSRNAISWASAGGHGNALRTLLQNGCPGIQDEDVDGWTPLAWAIQTDSPGVVEALLSTGLVDLERRDHGGKTALFWAVGYGHAPVVKVLLREGADPEAESYSGQTPASIAESYGRSDLLNELLFYVDRKITTSM